MIAPLVKVHTNVNNNRKLTNVWGCLSTLSHVVNTKYDPINTTVDATVNLPKGGQITYR